MQVQKYNKKWGMKKKEERTLKRKTLLKAGLGRNSFEAATGQPPNKKRVPVHRKLFFIYDVK
ncbi:hypothetical protein DXA05_16040 [Bacteroides sp. AM54-2NS]|nr:hypothetical protein DXA05_16040 [Bacteroides sp. AM54-2NS]